MLLKIAVVFNKVTGLRAFIFIKKDTGVFLLITTQVFSCEYHKMFENSFSMAHLRWLLLKMVEEFLRISNST